MTQPQQLTFTRWFERLGMAALAVISLWVGSQIRDLNATIQRLSEQIAIVSTDAKRDREDVKDLKDRVHVLEISKR